MTIKELDGYFFECHEEPSQDNLQVLFDGINGESFHRKQMQPIKPFGIFIKDRDGNVLGGACGITYYGCLYVDMLWLEDKLRHRGLGSHLMAEAEKIGRSRGCTFATVNTMDWEALAFYQKLNYEIEFTRQGYLKESAMYMLRKSL
jgi:ribosomal protein S18 acetylase RimI-like enzyme